MRIRFSELLSFPSSHLSCWVCRCSAPLRRQTLSYELFLLWQYLSKCKHGLPTCSLHCSEHSLTQNQNKTPWYVVAHFCTPESQMPNKITIWHQAIRGTILSRRWDLTAGWGNLHCLPASAPSCCVSPGRVLLPLCSSFLPSPPFLYPGPSHYPLLWFVTREGTTHKRAKEVPSLSGSSSIQTPGSQVSTKEFPWCLAAAMASQSTEFRKSHSVWQDWRQLSPPTGQLILTPPTFQESLQGHFPSVLPKLLPLAHHPKWRS